MDRRRAFQYSLGMKGLKILEEPNDWDSFTRYRNLHSRQTSITWMWRSNDSFHSSLTCSYWLVHTSLAVSKMSTNVFIITIYRAPGMDPAIFMAKMEYLLTSLNLIVLQSSLLRSLNHPITRFRLYWKHLASQHVNSFTTECWTAEMTVQFLKL